MGRSGRYGVGVNDDWGHNKDMHVECRMKAKERKPRATVQQQPGLVSRARHLMQMINPMFLINWPLVNLILATVVSFLLISRPHWTASDIPFGDGRWYAQQAIELYGLLHSGQWGKFWDLFCAPTTVTLVPSYLPFFLLPSVLATGVVYGLINCASWHLVMAYALYGMTRIAGRTALAAPIFLLVAANNYALDSAYYYYLDLPFAAMCLLALFFLMRALTTPGRRNFLVAGASAGITCFVKPGGSFVFLGLYVMTVGLWLVLPMFIKPRKSLRAICREAWGMMWPWMIAFIPFLVAAASWNLVQRIVQQWVENQGGSYYAEALTVKGLLRLFYFPLCLSYYYSFCLLGLITVLLVFKVWVMPSKTEVATFTSQAAWRLILVASSVFIIVWGLVFSWGMTFKPIRSLPVMLPILWLAFFSLPGLRRLSSRAIGMVAITYFICVHAQFAWGFIEKSSRSAETYHLTGDWINRLPAQAPNVENAIGITRSLVSALNQMGVSKGNVAVGSEMLYWNSCSLNWITQLEDLAAGCRPGITFKTAVDNKGNPIRSSFDSVSALILPVHPSIQYSREVYKMNVVIAQYVAQHWQPDGHAQMNVLKFNDGQPGVALVVFKRPLSLKEWDTLVRASFPAGYSTFAAASETFSKRLPWRELWRIINDQKGPDGKGRKHD